MDYLIRTDAGRKEIRSIIRQNVNAKNRIDDENDEIAGCTGNVCYITDKEILVANAGDSRCVACYTNRTVALSVDHKPQDEE